MVFILLVMIVCSYYAYQYCQLQTSIQHVTRVLAWYYHSNKLVVIRFYFLSIRSPAKGRATKN